MQNVPINLAPVVFNIDPATMHVRTFRAASLQDALEQIRRQMGSDAAVMHTRQVREGLLGWLGRTSVEVTAGLRDPNEGPTLRISEDSQGELHPPRWPFVWVTQACCDLNRSSAQPTE